MCGSPVESSVGVLKYAAVCVSRPSPWCDSQEGVRWCVDTVTRLAFPSRWGTSGWHCNVRSKPLPGKRTTYATRSVNCSRYCRSVPSPRQKACLPGGKHGLAAQRGAEHTVLTPRLPRCWGSCEQERAPEKRVQENTQLRLEGHNFVMIDLLVFSVFTLILFLFLIFAVLGRTLALPVPGTCPRSELHAQPFGAF